jgi:hypothetical protein
MSQNVEEDRKKFPKEYDSFTVGSKQVDTKKVWQPKNSYDQGGEYHKNKVYTTPAGHYVEMDDTKDGERIRIQHLNGSFVEFRPDGSVVYRSNKDAYEVVAGEKNIRVKGSVNIQVDGNADIKIGGNADVEVSGNLTAEIGGMTEIKSGGEIALKSPKLTHNEINIGYDHKHRDVMPGAGISGVPIGD